MLIFGLLESLYLKNMKTTSKTASSVWSPTCVLSIAGSDSGGGAGLQADLKTVSALGGYAACAVSAITVQNTLGVQKVLPVSTALLCDQVKAVLKDIQPQAVKISMLPEPDSAAALARILNDYACPNVVLDPVMVSTSGHSLVNGDSMRHVVKHLFPLAKIVTPNLEEVRALTGIFPVRKQEYERAAGIILDMGPQAVLLKGGHAGTNRRISDYLLCAGTGFMPTVISSPKIESKNRHGTGCTLSAAIAFYLACGLETAEAVSLAKEYIYRAIKTGKNMQVGEGNGPVNHFFAPKALCKPKNKI